MPPEVFAPTVKAHSAIYKETLKALRCFRTVAIFCGAVLPSLTISPSDAEERQLQARYLRFAVRTNLRELALALLRLTMYDSQA